MTDPRKVGGHQSGASATQYNISKYGRCVLITLGIIILTGSIIAAGCLYSRLGKYSFAVGGGGLGVGLVLIATGLYCRRPSLSEEAVAGIPPQEQMRPSLFEEAVAGIPPQKQMMKKADMRVEGPCNRYHPSKWFGADDLLMYMGYLYESYPDVIVPPDIDIYNRWAGDEICHVDSLDKWLFTHFLPHAEKHNAVGIPIYLSIPGIWHTGEGRHWTLVYIDRHKRTIEYYDSKQNYGKHKYIIRKLNEIAVKLSETNSALPAYQVICKINKCLQLDSYQCGPWLLYFLENRLRNSEVDFNTISHTETSRLMKLYRKHIFRVFTERKFGFFYQE